MNKISSLCMIIVIVVSVASSLRLDSDDSSSEDLTTGDDLARRRQYRIDSKSFVRPADAAKSSSSSYSNVKLKKDTAGRSSSSSSSSEFLEQNYVLSARQFDLDIDTSDLNVFVGAEPNLWVLDSSLPSTPSDNRLVKVDFGAERVEKFAATSNFFLNKFKPNIVILTDLNNKQISISKDNGKSLSKRATPFRPDMFYFMPIDNENVILGVETAEKENKLWITFDFGLSWSYLSATTKIAPEWEKSSDGPLKLVSIYFIDSPRRNLVKVNLDDLNAAAAAGAQIDDVDQFKKIVKSDVLNFELVDKKFLFTTSLINQDMNLEISRIAKDSNSNFMLAKFKFDPKPNRILDYKIVWSDENEMFVAVFSELNGKVRTDLFRTVDFKEFNFELDLKDLVFDDNIKVLNKRGGIFLANAIVNNDSERPLIKTMSRIAPDLTWKEIKMTPQLDDARLDLTSAKFMYSHEYETSLFDDPKSPDFALTTVRNQLGSQLGVCVSRGDAHEWSQLVGAGENIYTATYANYGHIVVSVDKSRPVDELIYSVNKGYEWKRMRFSRNTAVYVDEIISLSSSDAADATMRRGRFVIVATHPTKKTRMLFKIDAVQPTNQEYLPDIDDDLIADEEDEEPNVNSLSECTRMCLSSQKPNKLMCVTKEMICNKKVDCIDQTDEDGCDEDEDDIDETTTLENRHIPMPGQLKSMKTTDTIKLKTNSIRSDKSRFSLDYYLVGDKATSNEFVEIIRTHAVDDDLERGELMQFLEFGSGHMNKRKIFDFDDIQEGYVYTCLFFVQYENEPDVVYMLSEKIYFTSGGLLVGAASSSNALLIVLAVALSTLVLVSAVLVLACHRCRRHHKSIYRLKPHPYEAEISSISRTSRIKRSIFRTANISDLDHNKFLINDLSTDDSKVYNSPIVVG